MITTLIIEDELAAREELLGALGKYDDIEVDEHQPHIIIVSSYSRYTLRAFEANVLD